MTEVTVATNVTAWLVTGESGEADSAVDVSLGPGNDEAAEAASG
jgi:hypothetical protein